MEKKNICLKVCVSVILLCAVPCYAAIVVVDGTNSPYVLDEEVADYIKVTEEGILQIKPGGYASQGVYVNTGGTIEIYGSHTWTAGDFDVCIASSANVNLFTDSTGSIVLDTEYPPDATLDGTTITVDPTNGWTGKLTWAYEGTPYSLNISTLSNITIEIVGGGNPIEAQLWVFPSLINRYGPLSKILAIVRLPEGITKDEIDSDQMLVLYAEDYDVEIEASCQQIIQWSRNGTVRTTIFATFDKASLTDVVPNGDVELEVVGGLNTGESFCGSDTVRIVSWSW